MTNIERCASTVSEYFGTLISRLQAEAAELAKYFDSAAVNTESLRRVVRPWAMELLSERSCTGAGFVAQPGVIPDAHWYLAWWQGEKAKQIDSATYVTVDYTRNEWFRIPIETGGVHVTGPYLDYLCTRESALTATVAVVAAAGPVGVVGADTLLKDFEAVIIGAFRSADAVLVNSENRLIHASDPTLEPGSLIDPSSYQQGLGCGTLPFRVLAK